MCYSKCHGETLIFCLLSCCCLRVLHNEPTNLCRVFAFTWNAGGNGPEEDLHDALGLAKDAHGSARAINSANTSVLLPDVYVFGWEEVPVRLSYLLLEDPWIEFVKDTLKPFDYVKLKSTKLQGIMMAVFVRRDLLTRVRDVETSFLRTGFNGLWGNKGAVGVRFTMNGCHVCFVDAHLAAHDNMNDRRIQDYKDIRDGMEFKSLQTPRILDHEYVCVCVPVVSRCVSLVIVVRLALQSMLSLLRAPTPLLHLISMATHETV